MPNSNSSDQQLAIFEALLDNPITVTDGELSAIYKLKVSSLSDQSTPGHHFYVRSLLLNVTQFEELLAHFELKEIVRQEFDLWPSILKKHQDLGVSQELYTARYIRMYKSPETPAGRHEHDMTHRKIGYFL